MNRMLVNRIADAVLYEGYVLYPYRPSVKNRQRWTFGGLYPEAYCRLHGTGVASSNQTECLIHGSPATRFEAIVRFLHLTARQVGELEPPLAEWPEVAEVPFRPVEKLQVGDRLFHTWQEAQEREVVLPETTLAELLAGTRQTPFRFPGSHRLEPVRTPGGAVAGVLVREQQAVEGIIEVRAAVVAEALYRLTFRVVNHTSLEEGYCQERDSGILRSLASTHSILYVHQGEFVSLLDPPDCWRDAAAACRNVGAWPVLVGTDGIRDTMLSSPIILYDYPQVAPESLGDFFDGTEVDEMLTLRILTLTDEEKQAMAAIDDRTGTLLTRTEETAREQLSRLHGTLRDLRPLREDACG